MLARILLVLLCFAFTGCSQSTSGHDDRTPEEKQADAETTLAYIRETVQIAKDANAACVVQVHAKGKGSVGQSLDFYADTGLGAQALLFFNFGNNDPPVNRPAEVPVD